MTSVQRRRAPLQADPADGAEPPAHAAEATTHAFAPTPTGNGAPDVGADPVHTPVLPPPPMTNGRTSFIDGVHALRTKSGGAALGEHTLMIMGGIVAPLGLLFITLAWVGASRTPLLFEQIPYMISGGLLGLALVFLGSFFYFAHWITQLVKENRSQSAALVNAIAQLQDAFITSSGHHTVVTVNGTDGDASVATDEVRLVATQRGSMAHRETCAVVIGKDDLHAVTPDDGFAACKLCDPFDEAV